MSLKCMNGLADMDTKWKYEEILLRNVCKNVMFTSNNQDIVNENFIVLAKEMTMQRSLRLTCQNKMQQSCRFPWRSATYEQNIGLALFPHYIAMQIYESSHPAPSFDSKKRRARA